MLAGFVLKPPFDLDRDDRAYERMERFGYVTLAIDRDAGIEPTNIALLVEHGTLAAVGQLAKGALITTFERRASLVPYINLNRPCQLMSYLSVSSLAFDITRSRPCTDSGRFRQEHGRLSDPCAQQGHVPANLLLVSIS